MNRNWVSVVIVSLLAQTLALGAEEYLVRFSDDSPAALQDFLGHNGGKLDRVSEPGLLYKWTTAEKRATVWRANTEYIQPNHRLHLFESPSLTANRTAIIAALEGRSLSRGPAFPDNPAIQSPPTQSSSADPLLSKAWGLADIGADQAWGRTNQGKEIIVAVTDTGVDYNHEDLIANMWRNPGEVLDGIDNDHNGFVDDIVGWDFASNDNKPYDLSMQVMDILTSGGNPGHGTHCSGVIGARLNNGLGSSGVAPQVKIMALRFITEAGQGSDENAIKAVDYAVQMHANIINASWGAEKGESSDQALQDAIERAAKAGVLFIAAAGNGRVQGSSAAGFDNDTDPKPMVPASFPIDNIIAVAAIDSHENLAAFSNYGVKSVKVGAPGVKILSTTPGNNYQDTIIDLGPLQATWDGTSMAAPFVAGSAAVIWSQNPGSTWKDVKQTLLSNANSIPSLSGKVATGGRVDLRAIH